jgi:hypothetical protein
MSPRDKTEAKLHQALASATGAPLLPLPAYTAQYLAEHLANALVPSWLHERKCETAGEEIAHVLLMFGLFPPDWVDAHRAEVLATDGQAYDGELAMLRGLVRTLRVIVRDGTSDEKRRAEIERLLHQHAADDAAAREQGKSSHQADATDFFQPGHSYSHRNGWNDFHCVAITAHPTTGQRLAMGWLSERGEWHRPTVCNLGQWLHEYDGVHPPTSTEESPRG